MPVDAGAEGGCPPSASFPLFPTEEGPSYFVWLLDPCREVIAFLAAERVVLLCMRPDYSQAAPAWGSAWQSL